MLNWRKGLTWVAVAAASAAVVGLAALAGTSRASPAAAGDSAPAAGTPAPTAPVGVSSDYCLECHSKPGQTRNLPSGEQLYLTIDPEAFNGSVHGSAGYACVQCHTTIRTYPHPAFVIQNLREATLQLYMACKACHSDNYQKTLDSVHQAALRAGKENAAVCSDCHNPHYQTRLTDPVSHATLPSARVHIPQTCARCHSAVYDQYKQSVHGSALIGEGNPDVPTCIDCHGVHNIQDPLTTAFRVNSPELCAKCHTDPARMDKYSISTQVLNTYLADFHGTTVTLFERTAPGQPTNKPVCFDCHGVHNIVKPDDPQKGLEVKENLLKTCQRCHPSATTNFPDAWLSHYVPSAAAHPLVYYVNVFYKLLIPGTIGGMLIFVASDAYRRVSHRRNRRA